MKYLVDTDWVVEYLKGDRKTVNALTSIYDEGLATSIITISELYEGVYNLTTFKKHLEALEDFINGIEVLGISLEVGKTFGKIRSDLRKKGQLIDNFDLLIASTAVTHNLTILTNNVSHFERLGIKFKSIEDFA